MVSRFQVQSTFVHLVCWALAGFWIFFSLSMAREADLRFTEGKINYDVAWILLTFLGIFGIHRFYMGKWISGILYLFTLGIFGMGYIYDFWTLKDQITVVNKATS